MERQFNSINILVRKWLPQVVPPFLAACMLIGNIILVLVVSGETKTIGLVNDLVGFVKESLLFLIYFQALFIISLSFLALTSPNSRTSKIFSWVAEKSAHSTTHYVAIVFGLFPAIMIGIYGGIASDAIDAQLGWKVIIVLLGIVILVSVLGSMAAESGDFIDRISNKKFHHLVKPIFESKSNWFNAGFLILGLGFLAAPTIISLNTDKVKLQVSLSVTEYELITKASQPNGQTVEQFAEMILRDSIVNMKTE